VNPPSEGGAVGDLEAYSGGSHPPLASARPPPPPWAFAINSAISAATVRISSTSRRIFSQLHGRSPDTFPVRPLIRIWNSLSW